MNALDTHRTLNDGHTIPALGYGVFKIAPDYCERAVREAIDVGYRHFDTAQIYENEAEVGRAIRASGIPREEFFVTSKLWNPHQGRETTAKAFDDSLRALGTEYVDLFLIHWPMPKRDLYLETWEVLQGLAAEGRARSIGVSNFLVPHLERLLAHGDVVPAVNQIELHPAHQQPSVTAFCTSHAIAVEAYAPLGQGAYPLLEEPAVVEAGHAHGKTPAQVVIRWHLQRGHIVFPKTSNPARVRENFQVFDFALSTEQMRAIDALERGGRVSHHPDDIN